MRVQDAQVPQASFPGWLATIASKRRRAVHELRQRHGGGPLADPVGAREDQAGWQRFPPRGTGHELE